MATPTGGRRSLRRGAAMVAATCVLAVMIPPAMGQPPVSPPPLEVWLFFRDPPPGPTFGALSPATPITIVLQIRNAAGSQIQTVAGFHSSAFWGRLAFTGPDGGPASYKGGPGFDDRAAPLHCHSRKGVVQRPTTTSVVPLETLKPDFAVEITIEDARRLYDLARPGRYTVQAQIPILTFDGEASDAVIKDCDQLAGQPLGNVGQGAGLGRRAFVVPSNILEFVVRPPYRFVGFQPPLTSARECSESSCRRFALGSEIPVRFGLLDETKTPVDTATARIVATQISGVTPRRTVVDLGTRPGKPANQFEVDPALHQYTFHLDSKLLASGVWRIEAQLDDGSVHFVDIELR